MGIKDINIEDVAFYVDVPISIAKQWIDGTKEPTPDFQLSILEVLRDLGVPPKQAILEEKVESGGKATFQCTLRDWEGGVLAIITTPAGRYLGEINIISNVRPGLTTLHKIKRLSISYKHSTEEFIRNCIQLAEALKASVSLKLNFEDALDISCKRLFGLVPDASDQKQRLNK